MVLYVCSVQEILSVIQVADLIAQTGCGKNPHFSQGLSTEFTSPVMPSNTTELASVRGWIVSAVVAVVPAATLQLIINDVISFDQVVISLTVGNIHIQKDWIYGILVCVLFI